MGADLVVENLSYQYGLGALALNEVSFRVEAGESVGIIGANGAGKTSLLLHLNGHLLPQSGSLAIEGLLASKKSRELLRRKVGLLGDDADHHLLMDTVIGDIAFGPRNMGLAESEVAERVEYAMTLVGIESLAACNPQNLSLGQKRAVSLAGVLAMRPSILALDEPSVHLDAMHRRKLIQVLQGLTCTRIMASHDLDFLWETCTRIVLLHRGHIKAEGPCQTLLRNEALLAACDLELPLRLQKSE